MDLALEHLWLPAPEPKKRLMVVLHGLGDSAEGFLWIQEALSIDSLDYLLLNAPTPYYIGFSWYDLPPHEAPGIAKSRRVLDEVFSQIERHGYPPERTFLLGFSQGCLMTLEFGARYSRRLAGYVGVSGYSTDPEALLREMNPEVNHGDWLITHGTDDEVLPVSRTRDQMRFFNERGFKIDYREYMKPHTIDMRRELPDIREWLSNRVNAMEQRKQT
jgi:phospholipase/carboxylesterase